VLIPAVSFDEVYLEKSGQHVEKNFTKMLTKWAKDGPKCKLVIEHGHVASAILRTIAKKIDLVIMGTQGASGLKEFFVGSNTEKIVRRSTVPVIAVKKPAKFSSIRNIVFPNTLGEDQEELTLKVKALQNFFSATLHIVYVNTPGNFKPDSDTLPHLQRFARRFMLKEFTARVYNDTYQEEGIINFAEEVGADMIVMATHGRKGLSHLVNGSLAEDVVNHVDCPIWTFAAK
jgi:nucleotide-binding universal stress UspA family protein